MGEGRCGTRAAPQARRVGPRCVEEGCCWGCCLGGVGPWCMGEGCCGTRTVRRPCGAQAAPSTGHRCPWLGQGSICLRPGAPASLPMTRSRLDLFAPPGPSFPACLAFEVVQSVAQGQASATHTFLCGHVWVASTSPRAADCRPQSQSAPLPMSCFLSPDLFLLSSRWLWWTCCTASRCGWTPQHGAPWAPAPS